MRDEIHKFIMDCMMTASCSIRIDGYSAVFKNKTLYNDDGTFRVRVSFLNDMAFRDYKTPREFFDHITGGMSDRFRASPYCSQTA